MLQLDAMYVTTPYIPTSTNAMPSPPPPPPHHPSNDPHSHPLSDVWRRKICEWKYQIVDYYGMDREVVSVSMNYLDRYLSTYHTASTSTDNVVSRRRMGVDKRHFQLSAMTCLFLATKLYEPSTYEVNVRQPHGPAIRKRNVLRISALVELSRGCFDARAFLEMEQRVLFRLSWRMAPPTSVQFVQYYVEMLCYQVLHCSLDALDLEESSPSILPPRRANQTTRIGYSQRQSTSQTIRNVYEVARYLCELSVCVYELGCTHHKASTVALAAVCSAMQQLDVPHEIQRIFADSCVWHVRLEYDEDVKKVFDALEKLRPDGNNNKNDDSNDQNANDPDECINHATSSTSLCHQDLQPIIVDQNSPVCVSKQDQANNHKHVNQAHESEDADEMDTSMEIEPNCILSRNTAVAASEVLSEPPSLSRVVSERCPWDTLVPGNDNNKSFAVSNVADTNAKMESASVMDYPSANKSHSSKFHRASPINWISRKIHPSLHGPHEC